MPRLQWKLSMEFFLGEHIFDRIAILASLRLCDQRSGCRMSRALLGREALGQVTLGDCPLLQRLHSPVTPPEISAMIMQSRYILHVAGTSCARPDGQGSTAAGVELSSANRNPQNS